MSPAKPKDSRVNKNERQIILPFDFLYIQVLAVNISVVGDIDSGEV